MPQVLEVSKSKMSDAQGEMFTPAQVVRFEPLIASDRFVTLEEKIRGAIDSIKRQVVAENRYLSIAWSGGKDSSVTLNLAFAALREIKEDGGKVPPLFVVHSDTRVESPVIHAFNQQQIRQIKKFSAESGLDTRVMVAKPGLSNDWLVSLIGGRTVASVGANNKCQGMMKSYPLGQLKSKIRKYIASIEGCKPKDANLVTLIGTRRDESAARSIRMKQRGESAHEAVEAMSGSGELVLSPIADFTTMEIFDYLSGVRNGRIKSYADDKFEGLVDIYRAMNSGECMVTAYLAGTEQAKSGCASGRSGCWTCLRVSTDASAEAMIAEEEGKYLWLRPLNEWRNYLMARHFDPSARAWLGRTVDPENGYVNIMPNAYGPQFTLELLGTLLTIQRDEEIEARSLGIKPRFSVLSERQILAIDYMWGRYGYQQAFQAMRTYKAVYEDGVSFKLPDLATIPKFTQADISFRASMPFADHEYDKPWSGLQSIEHAILETQELTTTRSGQIVSNVATGDEFGFDEEGLELFLDFELDYALERFNTSINPYPSAVIHYLIGLGTVHLYKGTHGELDRILRVGNQLTRHGLQPILNDPQAIIAKLAAAFPNASASVPERREPVGTDVSEPAFEAEQFAFTFF